MEAKLTLRLEKSIIEKAKNYARRRNTSLSKLIERLFDSFDDFEEKRDANLSPLVKKIIGSIKLKDPADVKDERYRYLMEKYK